MMKNPSYVILWAIVGLSVVLGIALAFGSTETRDGDEQVSLSLWSNFFLLLAAVSFVGALVVASVRRVLRNAGLDV